MSDYKIQPLRVYPDWQVLYNQFYIVDEITEENIDIVDSIYLLKLYSQQRNQFIAMWWRPETDVNGCYHIEVTHVLEVFNTKTNSFDLKFDEEPHTFFESRNRLEIVEKLEEDFMWRLPVYEDPRILKNRGEISQPSESYRIELEKNGLTEEVLYNILTDGNRLIQDLTLDHQNITKEIINRFANETNFIKVKNKAVQKLKNKRFR